MRPTLPEPERHPVQTGASFARYLSYYRETAISRCRDLPADRLRVGSLPSGWNPLELLNHLAHMERRWFVWGFLGERVSDPWGDSAGHPDRPWSVPPSIGLDEVERMLRAVGERTTQVLASHDQTERATLGGRFEADPPTLAGICFHVLQEHARHAGHLDVAVELAGGLSGE